MYVCMYVYIYIYTYVKTYIYIYTYIHIYIYIYIYIHPSLYIYIERDICIHTRIYMIWQGHSNQNPFMNTHNFFPPSTSANPPYRYFLFVLVVTHRVFHTRLPGVCSDGRPESPSESLNRSDA